MGWRRIPTRKSLWATSGARGGAIVPPITDTLEIRIKAMHNTARATEQIEIELK